MVVVANDHGKASHHVRQPGRHRLGDVPVNVEIGGQALLTLSL